MKNEIVLMNNYAKNMLNNSFVHCYREVQISNSWSKRIEENVQRRNVIAKRYLQELDGLPVSFQACSADNRNAYHLFIILAERRDELYTFLRETGIFSQVHYTPVNDLSFYKKKYGELNLPIAKGYIEKTLSIPMFQSMTDDEQSYVISKIREFYGK